MCAGRDEGRRHMERCHTTRPADAAAHAALRSAVLHDITKPSSKPVIFVIHLLGSYGLLVAVLGADPLSGQVVSRGVYLLAFALYMVYGVCITAGYHRLFAHRAYHATWPVKWSLLFLACGAMQASAIRWAWQHRVHHRHSDTDADPHNRRRGFWHCHIGYLFHKHADFVEAVRSEAVDDLLGDAAVRLQFRLWLPTGLLLCLGVPAAAGHFWLGGRGWASVLVAGFARLLLSLHATWAVNSMTHAATPCPADKPYGSRGLAVEHAFVSLIAWGEGWHDWHHKYPHDYAAAAKPWWMQVNPTLALLDALAALRLVSVTKRRPR